ncbi:MAG TPA: YihY/virulence factor BrkB family protein [Gaiellaceae bacterium]|nr:YihY/virulence factor BrkB family protein [Gaiellaceae bacterium]
MHIRETLSKFLADRGTHLAAMIAYFALLSFVPLVFLTLAFLGLGGRTTESSYFVEELEKIFPSASVSGIVDGVEKIRRNAASLGLIGGAFLLWSSLSLFSVLESAFNIVYGRPNRGFLIGKARATVFMLASLIVLFAGLLVGGLGAHLLDRFAPGFLSNTIVAHSVSVIVSAVAIFIFLVSAYHYLTNADLTIKAVLPGAIVATVALEATFQVLPLFLDFSRHNASAQVIGAPLLLLIWLYVMANLIVFGAEVNWRRAQS